MGCIGYTLVYCVHAQCGVALLLVVGKYPCYEPPVAMQLAVTASTTVASSISAIQHCCLHCVLILFLHVVFIFVCYTTRTQVCKEHVQHPNVVKLFASCLKAIMAFPGEH
jgi:hypothetical protein